MLTEYNKKRDFSQTPEPQGEKKNTTGALRFVVQKHAASQLHYDFRIELNGVLKSWAVPKGPSLNPRNKRLAMMVEDHPISYYDFEGTIPEGNYGGGTVMVWDKGTYHIPTSNSRSVTEQVVNEELERGNIKIFLEGEKLRGEFALVKLKNTENSWLLIKHRDSFSKRYDEEKDYSVLSGRSMEQIREDKDRKWESNKFKDDKNTTDELDLTGAIKSDMPSEIKPMLATLVDDSFTNEDWIFENKLDGYRAIASVSPKKIELYSRNKLSFTDKYPEIVKELKEFQFEAVFDGEIAVEDEDRITSFQLLQQYPKYKEGRLKYYIFDILYFNGFDLRNVHLINRKKILKKIISNSNHLELVKYFPKKGEELFEKVKRKSEGVIAKKKSSVYESGVRSENWLKIKSRLQQEAIICGYTEPQGSREVLGAIVLGIYRNNELVHIGNVGTGFNSNILADLKKKLQPLEIKNPPFKNTPKFYRNIHWVSPKLICEIEFAGWTQDRNVRQASFIGLREDKEPKEVVKETAEDTEKLISESGKDIIDLRISNPTKVYWPDENITKLDLVHYYKNISGFILPYLKDRPESLHRQPNGIQEKGFFQKDVDELTPDWIQTIKLPSESRDKDINYILCQNVETLMFMVNWGCIEINPWNSRIDTLDYPDYVVFDLDPLGVSFRRVVEVALMLREIFDEIEVPSYVKTSGSKGIHIFVPLGAQYTYDQAQQFAKIVELEVNSRLPNITSLERNPDRRKGKVYLDYLQNSRGKTMASVYSVRPRRGATISTPLRWEEINEHLNPAEFTIKNILDRLDRTGDVWKDIFKNNINMLKSIELLNEMISK